MTAVGDKTILKTETLLLADDEIGKFVVPIRDGNGTSVGALEVSVQFTAPNASEASARWEYDHGVLKMVFSGWADREGSGFRRAQRLGEHRGIPFGFNVAHQRFGDLNQATFQFYAGGTYE
jgi:hypothetical protein